MRCALALLGALLLCSACAGKASSDGAGDGTELPGAGAPGPAAPPPASRPAVTRIDAVIKGAIDHDRVHASATAIEPQILACYRGALERKPGLGGLIAIRYIIDRRGVILSANLTEPVPDGVFAECLLTAAKTASFPELSDGKTATITQPFTLAVE